jgi:hypothetical protein
MVSKYLSRILFLFILMMWCLLLQLIFPYVLDVATVAILCLFAGISLTCLSEREEVHQGLQLLGLAIHFFGSSR